jgi:hypothetical protein
VPVDAAVRTAAVNSLVGSVVFIGAVSAARPGERALRQYLRGRFTHLQRRMDCEAERTAMNFNLWNDSRIWVEVIFGDR